MRNCFCIILFLVLSLTLPAASAYAYGGGGGGGGAGGGGGGGGGEGGGEAASTSSDTTNPPSGFKPAKQENADGDSTVLENISDIEPSAETDPGKEEEVAELVDEVNLMEEGTKEGDVEGDSKDSAEETASDENAPDEDPEDKNTELATLVDDVNPNGSSQESETTSSQAPGQGLIGTKGTLPGTKSATLDKIDTEKNEDGSVSTWAEYSNDTWVHTTVKPDGTKDVVIHLASGTMIRPGREYIHTGGSLNPLLDYTITALETAAAAGTVAGWVLTVTPAGALASGGVKSAQAVWVATTGIQAVRAGADVYGQKINEGASQADAAWEGTKQTAVNAVVVTKIGKHIGTPYEKTIGSVFGKTGKKVTEVAVKNYANYAADRSTKNITGYSPGYKPW